MSTQETKVYQFDSIIFVEDRTAFNRLLKSGKSGARAFKRMAEQFALQGIHQLDSIYLSEDDEQSNSDIKVFVCARLIGQLRPELSENDMAPAMLVPLLDSLAECVCGDDYAPENWELLSIDELEMA